MRIRLTKHLIVDVTKRVVITFVAYVLICVVLVIIWDVIWKPSLPLFASILAGLLTVIGGVLLVLWLIEGDRLRREVETKERVVSTLKILRNFLLPWIYHYAIALSGHVELHDDYVANKIANRRFKDDINLLEYIFGIREVDKNGNLIRGNYPEPDEKILTHPLALQTIRGSLDYGLRELEEIEKRIKEFPSFPEEIDTEIAKIIHLSAFIRERLTELEEWERNYGEDQDYEIEFSMSNVAIRGNLKTVGRIALNVVIAIDANLNKMEAQL